MQKSDHRSLIYGIIGTKEQVLVRQGKRPISVQAIEVFTKQITGRKIPAYEEQPSPSKDKPYSTALCYIVGISQILQIHYSALFLL